MRIGVKPKPKNPDQAAALVATWLSQGKAVQTCSDKLREFGYKQEQVVSILRDACTRLVGPNELDDKSHFAIAIARADRCVELAAASGNPQVLAAALRLMHDALALPAERAAAASRIRANRQ